MVLSFTGRLWMFTSSHDRAISVVIVITSRGFLPCFISATLLFAAIALSSFVETAHLHDAILLSTPICMAQSVAFTIARRDWYKIESRCLYRSPHLRIWIR